ncbi:type IV toxin-antitoxin system AbiEi family antitoxin domain-containing protein [Glycomyces harbinensis]|uniref:Transcriptional regulator, AbiEi antitoxin, Type IV TA system n=1 Tax=Glycomyces harbinensis TaxID=58114 RepID=A0A1G6W494_9ACTN|nr:type IV toxin-antitoxin system AbiEi family antitoxin domain-containing protein [Glycomyces harbinensis]SDD60037.1 Transcriptional regulator, AbiEi antitoxin, Type IV TA system [Glycomyces harbinensis]
MGGDRGQARERLRELPPVFSYRMAIDAGIAKSKLYRLRDEGFIETVGRGRFRVTDAELPPDLELHEIAQRAPEATICLVSALSRHDLTDQIPAAIDIAIPRGRRRPVIEAPVAWHSFDPETFDIGHTELELDEETVIGLYGPERSIIDAFRLRHLEGHELAVEALKRWLRRPGSSPAALLAMARDFPKARPALQTALEILL